MPVWQRAERLIAQIDLAEARRRAQLDAPFSPAWDSDMRRVEDLERALWRIDHPEVAPRPTQTPVQEPDARAV